MGMKHLSEYHEDWNFGEDMWWNHPKWVENDRTYCHKRLNNWNMTTVGLFCWPSDYYLIFNSTRKEHTRKCWPICYLVALDDVIPIKIDPEPIVALQDKKELDYVWNTHKEILDIALQIIRDNWKDVLLHYLGYLEDDDIHKVIRNNNCYGVKYAPNFLKGHPPVTVEPVTIYKMEDSKCVKIRVKD